ncbi:UNVERIFIED_CONTAM: hypothetical protein Sradi_6839400 [Sesamum radiatum]|uniref:Uncharacterized protein n=1 Tax=Sesamum radiatum TaxID=300843 RepID=A0AAW2JM01_SESRA
MVDDLMVYDPQSTREEEGSTTKSLTNFSSSLGEETSPSLPLPFPPPRLVSDKMMSPLVADSSGHTLRTGNPPLGSGLRASSSR